MSLPSDGDAPEIPPGKPEGDDEPVGYGRPPNRTKFQKGNQAARRHGRPKERRNNATILQAIVDHKITITVPGGKSRKMSLWEAGAWKLAVKAAQGDFRGWAELNRICVEYGIIRPAPPWDDEITPEEEQTIESYFVSWALSVPSRAFDLLQRLEPIVPAKIMTTHRSSRGPTVRIVDFGYAEGPVPEPYARSAS